MVVTVQFPQTQYLHATLHKLLVPFVLFGGAVAPYGTVSPNRANIHIVTNCQLPGSGGKVSVVLGKTRYQFQQYLRNSLI